MRVLIYEYHTFQRQWEKNGGKCGVCGDAWDLAQPRENEVRINIKNYLRHFVINVLLTYYVLLNIEVWVAFC